MTCPNCGASVAEHRRFCGKCGTALAGTSAPADVPTASPPSPGPLNPPNSWGPPAAPSPQWGPPPPMPPSAPSGAHDPFAPPELGPPPGQNPWAGYGPTPTQYPPPGSAGPQPPYPPGQYPSGYPCAPGAWPGYGYGYGYAPPHTNGLAIASFVLGLGGWLLCGVGSVVAIVLGFVSRNQIKQSWGRQTGSGFATAGIVLGFIGASFWIIALMIQLVHAAGSSG